MKLPTLLWLPATLGALGGAVALYFVWPRAEPTAPAGETKGLAEPAAGAEPPPRAGATVLSMLHLGSRVGRIEEWETRDGHGRAGTERLVRLQVRRAERRATLTRTLTSVVDARGLLAEASLQAPGLRVDARVLPEGKVALTVAAHGQSTTHELHAPPGAPVHTESTAFAWLARNGFSRGARADGGRSVGGASDGGSAATARGERMAWLDLEHGRLQEVTVRVGGGRDWHGLRGTELTVALPFGVEWTALVDDAGRVLESQSLVPGVESRRWRPVDDSRPLHAVDLGGWGQVLTAGALPDAGRLRALRLGVRGVPTTMLPAEVELRAAPLPADEAPLESDAALGPNRAAAPFLERDAPQIVERARALAPPGTPPLQAARAVAEFVATHVKQRDAVGPPSALATLLTGRGNCNELAALSVALLRAAGHGARLVFGVALQAGALRYHAWAQVRTRSGWTAFDPTLRQFPADVTHLRLSAGGLEAQAAVLAATGRLTLQVLSTQEEP